MANYTEKAIFRAFEELLEEKPFDKITVSAIVSKSEVSANTFTITFRTFTTCWTNGLTGRKTSLSQ